MDSHDHGGSRLLALSVNLPAAMERREWSLDDYHILDTLYSGYAAKVYTATCKYSGMLVVLKVYADIHKAPDVAQHEMFREVAIQSGLQHPNIVHLFAAFKEGQTLALVQEWAGGGDLLGLMARQGGRCDEATVAEGVVRPLLGALLYLHRWGIVHRDVKPENVLFGGDGRVRLADFGLAINMLEERPISRVGTLDYMAPEVLCCPVKQSMAAAPGPHATPRYGFATDVWAVGVVAYELLTGLPPYAADCRVEAERRIVASAPPAFPHALSPGARDLIARCLAPHPGDRPTVRQLLAHPWLAPGGAAAAAAAQAPWMAAQREAPWAEVAVQPRAVLAAGPAPPCVVTSGGAVGGSAHSQSGGVPVPVGRDVGVERGRGRGGAAGAQWGAECAAYAGAAPADAHAYSHAEPMQLSPRPSAQAPPPPHPLQTGCPDRPLGCGHHDTPPSRLPSRPLPAPPPLQPPPAPPHHPHHLRIQHADDADLDLALHPSPPGPSPPGPSHRLSLPPTQPLARPPPPAPLQPLEPQEPLPGMHSHPHPHPRCTDPGPQAPPARHATTMECRGWGEAHVLEGDHFEERRSLRGAPRDRQPAAARPAHSTPQQQPSQPQQHQEPGTPYCSLPMPLPEAEAATSPLDRAGSFPHEHRAAPAAASAGEGEGEAAAGGGGGAAAVHAALVALSRQAPSALAALPPGDLAAAVAALQAALALAQGGAREGGDAAMAEGAAGGGGRGAAGPAASAPAPLPDSPFARAGGLAAAILQRERAALTQREPHAAAAAAEASPTDLYGERRADADMSCGGGGGYAYASSSAASGHTAYHTPAYAGAQGPEQRSYQHHRHSAAGGGACAQPAWGAGWEGAPGPHAQSPYPPHPQLPPPQLYAACGARSRSRHHPYTYDAPRAAHAHAHPPPPPQQAFTHAGQQQQLSEPAALCAAGAQPQSQARHIPYPTQQPAAALPASSGGGRAHHATALHHPHPHPHPHHDQLLGHQQPHHAHHHPEGDGLVYVSIGGGGGGGGHKAAADGGKGGWGHGRGRGDGAGAGDGGLQAARDVAAWLQQLAAM